MSNSAFVAESNASSPRNGMPSPSFDGGHRPMSAFGYPTEHPALPMEEVGRVNRNAQIRGTMDGLFAGLLGSSFMRFFLRRSANAVVLTGFAVGSLVGYASSFAHVRQGLAQLERSMPERQLAEMQKLDLQAGRQPGFEAGVGGLHNFHDKAHSTRGDH